MRICPFVALLLGRILGFQIGQKVAIRSALLTTLYQSRERVLIARWLLASILALGLSITEKFIMHAQFLGVVLGFTVLLLGPCNPRIDALLRLGGVLLESLDLAVVYSLVQNVSEALIVLGRIAGHDLLIDPGHAPLGFGIGGQQGLALLITALVLCGESRYRVGADGVGELGTEKLSPVKNVVVNVEGLVSAASAVVAGATAWVAEDGVGESDFLELAVCGFFVLGLDLVCDIVSVQRAQRMWQRTVWSRTRMPF